MLMDKDVQAIQSQQTDRPTWEKQVHYRYKTV